MRIVEPEDIPVAAADVPTTEPVRVYRICLDMQFLCELNAGVGLSAMQVGVPWRLFIVKGDGTCPLLPRNRYGYFVNCEYRAADPEPVVSLEGCLSLRSKDGRLRSFQVQRFKEIKLVGSQLVFEGGKLSFTDVDVLVRADRQGVVFQHEIDHHRPVLISDIGSEVFVW